MTILDATSRIGDSVEVQVDGVVMHAYIPVDLPFTPPLQIDPECQKLLQAAYYALGLLDGAASALPDRNLLLYMYLRKEAVLSSQIEGTQSSLEGFLRNESAAAPGLHRDDIREIMNYVSALEQGLAEMPGQPVTSDLLMRLHKVLLSSGRGSDKQPGRLRDRQIFVGSTNRIAYVPPPPDFVQAKLDNLCTYMDRILQLEGALLVAALAHVQFESIHPFMDGNGRLGRMLVPLLLCRAGLLRWPMLFLSHYLMKHRRDYYGFLTDAREHGDWEGWLKFFLTAVRDTAQIAADSARAVTELLVEDRLRLGKLGRQEGSARQVYEHLLSRPLTDVPETAMVTNLTAVTARSVLERFVSIGICSEVTGGRRNRLYRYDAYLDILNAGTEL